MAHTPNLHHLRKDFFCCRKRLKAASHQQLPERRLSGSCCQGSDTLCRGKKALNLVERGIVRVAADLTAGMGEFSGATYLHPASLYY